jgi:phosphoglycolate phosphatase
MDTEPLLVFDLDGTLTDSAPDIAASVNRMLAARGLPSLAVPAVAAMVGDGVAPLMQRAFAAVGGVQDAAAAADYLRDYESNVAVETRLFAGMEAALDGLRAAGWRLAVCTNKPERAAHLLLEALGVRGYFAAIGGGDSFAHHKPHPEHLTGTIAAAGGDPGAALMLGDHTNDMLAAEGAGVRAMFAGWGYGRPGMERGAAAIVARPEGLIETAESLRKQFFFEKKNQKTFDSLEATANE